MSLRRRRGNEFSWNALAKSLSWKFQVADFYVSFPEKLLNLLRLFLLIKSVYYLSVGYMPLIRWKFGNYEPPSMQWILSQVRFKEVPQACKSRVYFFRICPSWIWNETFHFVFSRAAVGLYFTCKTRRTEIKNCSLKLRTHSQKLSNQKTSKYL